MQTDVVAGLAWIAIAGVMQGMFALPMKYVRRWRWEHLWSVYSLVAFFVLPLAVAWATVPRLGEVYQHSPGLALVQTAIFGVAWGAGSVCFGLGVDAWGLSVGFPLMTGLYTSLGALVPMALLTPHLLFTTKGWIVLGGNALTVVSVCLFAYAGRLRDGVRGAPPPATLGVQRTFAGALVICLLAGVLSAMFNFGYAFGGSIQRAAQELGATESDALNAVWLVMIPAGGLVNLLYCLRLMCRAGNGGGLLEGRATDWTSAIVMALLWMGSVVVYGWGVTPLGALGPTLGWSLWNAVMIAATMGGGLMSGEWTGVHGWPRAWLLSAATVLVAGMAVLGFGS
jgi:L-rhamnose-H+ transport protein